MPVIIVSFCFGIFQVFMLKKLLNSATNSDFKHLAIYLVIKFIGYAIAISLMMLLFYDKLVYCIIGYTVGLPVSAAIWFIYYMINKKDSDTGDDKYENNNNN